LFVQPKGSKKKCKHLKRRIPNKRVNESQLKRIAELLTNGIWKKFARHIGVSDHDIEDIQVAYRGDPEEQRYQMVRRWWDMTDSPSFSVLCDAAEKLQRMQLCDSLVRLAQSSTETMDATFEIDSDEERTFPLGTSEEIDPLLQENTMPRSSTGNLGVTAAQQDYSLQSIESVERSPSPIQHSQSYTPLSSERRGSFETPKLRRAQSDVGSSRVANRYAVDNGQIPLIPEVARTTPGPDENQSLLEQDQDLRDKAERTFDVSNFWIKTFVKFAKDRREFSLMIVCIVFIVQLIVSLSFTAQFNHHQGSWLPILLPLLLDLLTNVAFPASLTFVFWHVIDVGNNVGDRGITFMKEMVKDSNAEIVESMLNVYAGEDHEEEKRSVSHRIYFMRHNIEKEMQNMCISSIVQVLISCLILFVLYQSHRCHKDLPIPYGPLVCIVLRSFIQSFLGIMFSFFFRDMNIRYYVLAIQKQCYSKNGPDSLSKSAQYVEQCLNKRWYKLEIFCAYATVMYFVLSLVSCCMGISLSYNPCFESPSHSYTWVVVLVALAIGHLVASAPYDLGLVRFVAPVVQSLVLVCVWWSYGLQPEWMKSLDLLHLALPIGYLLWYYDSVIRHTRMSWKSPPSYCHTVAESNLSLHFGLIFLIFVTVVVAIPVEYRHTGVQNAGELNSESSSLEHLSELANIHCVPKSYPLSCGKNAVSTTMKDVLEKHFFTDTPCVFLNKEEKVVVQTAMNKPFLDHFKDQ
jgi:hypothetical protein